LLNEGILLALPKLGLTINRKLSKAMETLPDFEPKPLKDVPRKRHAADYGYPVSDLEFLKAKALEIAQRLTEKYGVAAWSKKDPMSMLVDILLSHRTRDEHTAQAYANLLEHFGNWEAVRDAPTGEIQKTIRVVTFPELKAPRIQAVMHRITEERGNLNLDFLHDLPVEEGATWLRRFEGVGYKTAACVLLFSCRKPILPVDTHVHRLSIRLGLIGAKVNAENAHPLLQALLPNDAQIIYNFHKGLLRHGQKICTYDNPCCTLCPLTDICTYYQTMVKPKAPLFSEERGKRNEERGERREE
jgi:endonuclease III